MKYKVGDKFLVEAEIIGISETDTMLPYRLSGPWPDRSEEALDNLRRPDDMTADEAWAIARKIVGSALYGRYTFEELDKIFGSTSICDIFEENTPQEAKAKIEAWEAEKEIKVGDEVTPKENDNDEHKFFVTYKDEDEIGGFSGFTGEVFSGRNIDNYIKTGRHIDIQSVLEQIGGAE